MANWITVEDSLKGRARAVEREQERIIKLLEELKEFWSEKMTLEYGEAAMINVDEAIALIKRKPNE
jgi:hypothetical protein